jgi:16S rRNA (guanine527-N7)-methyltransferase
VTAAGRLQSILQSLGQPALSPEQATAFETYLALLLRWNARVNLTAIRDEDSILLRHFVESITCARLLPSGVTTVLDYGSGGGFPGVPCAICLPQVRVTLAESQNKKSAFLQEVVRTLGLEAAVHAGRVATLPATALFDVVTLRAVDKMQEACADAVTRVRTGGWLAILSTTSSLGSLVEDLRGIAWRPPQSLLGTEQEVLLLGRRLAA